VPFVSLLGRLRTLAGFAVGALLEAAGLGAEGTAAYTVRAGDTLYTLSVRSGTTVQALARGNGLRNPDLIPIGQTLNVPIARAAPELAADPAFTPQVGFVADPSRWRAIRFERVTH
jgi:LysM repeat protein